MGVVAEDSGQRSIAPRAWLAPTVALALASVLAFLLWSPAAIGVFVDDGVYVLLAKALASGEGLRYTGVAGAPPAPKHPPLYPLILAAVWKVVPRFPANAPYLKAVGVVFAVLGAAAFAWYIEQILRLPRWFALVVTTGVWLTVDVWRYAVVPLSEPVFLFALILALAAAARSEQKPGATTAVLLLASFAALYYTRTIGIVLAAGAVCAHLLARRWRAAFVVAAGALVVVMPWLLWTRSVSAQVPRSLAEMLGGYGSHLTSQVAASPFAYLQGLPLRTGEIGRRVLDIMVPAAPATLQLVLAPLLLALVITGMIQLWRRSPTMVLTVAAYLAALCLWPFVARRLIAPIAPFLLLALAAGFFHLYQRAPEVGWRRPAVRTLAGVWLLYFAGASAVKLYARDHDLIHIRRSVDLLAAAQAVSQHVPDSAVVVAPEFWAGLHLYTGRVVAPSVRFRPVGAGVARWGTPAEQLAIWHDVGAEYVLLEFGTAVHGSTLTLVQERCGTNAVLLVSRARDMDLVRLVLDEACAAKLRQTGAA